MDEIETAPDEAPGRWAQRPWLLAVLGLATGIVAHLILGSTQIYDNDLDGVQAALLLGVTLGAALIGFTIERRLWWGSLAFGAVMGVVAFFVTLGNGAPGGWSSSELWRIMSLVLALAIAAPLFQAARDAWTLRPSYIGVHDHVWANLVLWCASWLFVAIVWVMAILLSELFHLIRIDFVRDLLAKDWFGRAMTGLAFGSALGLLREHDLVVRTLQRAVAMVLGVLAPVLAVGLGLFLFALPFTGVQALWDATSDTTPLLLTCAAGALILANVVIGREAADERRNPLLRYGAMVLAAVILPLAVLAAFATSLRVGQYGYTPERLWAVVFVTIACLWGTAYLVALVRGRMQWTQRVRPANLLLAVLICLLGFVLATPLISFNRISARDQVARLESGKTSPEQFDWAALAFDFGEPGKAALRKLTSAKNAAIRAKAIAASQAPNRWVVEHGNSRERDREKLTQTLRLVPAGHPPVPELRDQVANNDPACAGMFKCTLAFVGDEALLFNDSCFGVPATPGTALKTDKSFFEPIEYCRVLNRWVLADGKWGRPTVRPSADTALDKANRAKGYAEGRIEVRPVQRRQVFVGGVPVGEAFE